MAVAATNTDKPLPKTSTSDINVVALDSLDPDDRKTESVKLSHIIKLNVGGTKFVTSRSTLQSSGYFRALLSGNFADAPDTDGHYFIDRNAVLFGYLLDYMRSGIVSVPRDCLEELEVEAKYLQIDLDLSTHIEASKPQTVTIECRSVIFHNSKHVHINDIDIHNYQERERIFKALNVDAYPYWNDPARIAAYLARNGFEVSACSLGGDVRNSYILKKALSTKVVLRKVH